MRRRLDTVLAGLSGMLAGTTAPPAGEPLTVVKSDNDAFERLLGDIQALALRQRVPLRTCVENPQHCFEHMTGRYRLAPRTSIGNMLLRKMLPNALPLFVREPNHSAFIADRQQSLILR